MSQDDDKPPHRQPVTKPRHGGWVTPGEAREAIAEILAKLDGKGKKPEREPGDDDPEAA